MARPKRTKKSSAGKNKTAARNHRVAQTASAQDEWLPANILAAVQKDNQRKDQVRQQDAQRRIANEKKIEQEKLEKERQRLLDKREYQRELVLQEIQAAKKARKAELVRQRAESRQAKERFAAAAKEASAETQSKAEDCSASPVLFPDGPATESNNQNIDKTVECDLSFVFRVYGKADSALEEQFDSAKDRLCCRALGTNGWKALGGDMKSPKCALRMQEKLKHTLPPSTKSLIKRVAECCEFYELKIKHGQGARIFGFSYPNDYADGIITIQPVLLKHKHKYGDEFQGVFEEAIRTLAKNSVEQLPIFAALEWQGETPSASLSKTARNDF